MRAWKDWDLQIPYRPSNYVAELEEFRRELLTAARDYGRDVRTSVDCALREIGNPGRFSEYTHQIYLLAERLATNINVLLGGRFQSGPGDSEDRRLILAMQLRAQALCLYILMGSGMCFPLTEIESVEDYRRNFDTGPDSRDIVTEHWDELADPNPTLDLVRIRDDLEREIHIYDLSIQELSELIESLSNPVNFPENRRGVAVAVPETEAEPTPVSELGSENHRSGGIQSDFRADMEVSEEVAPAAACDQIGETSLAREGSDRASLDLETIVQRLSSLQEIELFILIIASEHRISRRDIHATLSRRRFPRHINSVSNILTRLKHDLLLVRLERRLWQTAAAVATYLNEGSDHPPNVSSALERFRILRNSDGNETTQS